jgi:hypothetical protein
MYIKTRRFILLAVLKRGDDHLPAKLGNQFKMHSASSDLPVFSELMDKFVKK